jgi:hypothetical protein
MIGYLVKSIIQIHNVRTMIVHEAILPNTDPMSTKSLPLPQLTLAMRGKYWESSQEIT